MSGIFEYILIYGHGDINEKSQKHSEARKQVQIEKNIKNSFTLNPEYQYKHCDQYFNSILTTNRIGRQSIVFDK